MVHPFSISRVHLTIEALSSHCNILGYIQREPEDPLNNFEWLQFLDNQASFSNGNFVNAEVVTGLLMANIPRGSNRVKLKHFPSALKLLH